MAMLGKSARTGGLVMLKPITAFQVIGAPVGKGRPKFARRGNFVQAYTPTKTKDYEALVQDAAKSAMGEKSPCSQAVQMNVEIYVTPPVSWSKKKRTAALEGVVRPTTKPDIDNVIKGIFDAINDIVFLDDKQVVSLSVMKSYAEQARVVVRAYEIFKEN